MSAGRSRATIPQCLGGGFHTCGRTKVFLVAGIGQNTEFHEEHGLLCVDASGEGTLLRSDGGPCVRVDAIVGQQLPEPPREGLVENGCKSSRIRADLFRWTSVPLRIGALPVGVVDGEPAPLRRIAVQT